MEPLNLHFNFRDIFRSPRLALSGKKIWTFIVANFVAYVIYFILNYIALSLSGQSFNETWNTQGIYPCLYLLGGPWFAWALFWTSILFWIFTIQLASTAVARITYKQLKGDDFFSANDGWRYVKKHWHPIIFSPISLILILFLFLAISALFALIGKIPYLGEFIFALPYPVYFFGSMFTIYTGIVLVISFLYSPAIVATMEEDTMGAVFNSYAITWSQPWRIITYYAILIPIATIGVTTLKIFSFYSIKLINTIFSHYILMGSKLTDIFGSAADIVWPKELFLSISTGLTTCSLLCGNSCNLSVHLNVFYSRFIPSAPQSISGSEYFATIFLSIFLFILTLSFLSYMLSILSVGNTLMFSIYRMRSDNDNILTHKDEDELEEEKIDVNLITKTNDV